MARVVRAVLALAEDASSGTAPTRAYVASAAEDALLALHGVHAPRDAHGARVALRLLARACRAAGVVSPHCASRWRAHALRVERTLYALRLRRVLPRTSCTCTGACSAHDEDDAVRTSSPPHDTTTASADADSTRPRITNASSGTGASAAHSRHSVAEVPSSHHASAGCAGTSALHDAP